MNAPVHVTGAFSFCRRPVVALGRYAQAIIAEHIMWQQAPQLIGAFLQLVAFGAGQRGWLNPASVRYLMLNAVGSVLLLADAVRMQAWGFTLLEAAWLMIAALGLARLSRVRDRCRKLWK